MNPTSQSPAALPRAPQPKCHEAFRVQPCLSPTIPPQAKQHMARAGIVRGVVWARRVICRSSCDTA